MGLNDTPLAERTRIGFFGCMNAGKSSVINAVAGQDVSVVSAIKGTTTDPVKKTMELLPLGPVVLIDTPGIDDSGILGDMRAEKAARILDSVDIAVVVIDAQSGRTLYDERLTERLEKRNIPYIIVYNKADCISVRDSGLQYVSALTGEGIEQLRAKIATVPSEKKRPVIDFGIKRNDIAVLVMPIDESAPKGRIILPQQMLIRELLERNCITVAVQPDQLNFIFENREFVPSVVVTDSQVFRYVAGIVPPYIKLTSFSILFANKKGFLRNAVEGVSAVRKLNDNDVILISEACTHHRQCNDIGSVKIPAWIEEYTGKHLRFVYSSGESFPDDLTPYSMIVHCGACMINDNMLKNRADMAEQQGIPFTNFGILIAYVGGLLSRSLEVFPDIRKLIDQ